MKKLFVLMFCMVLLVGTVTAFEFDNVKQYDRDTKTITVRDSILGIPTTRVAEIHLDTPLNFRVSRNYGKVAQFTVTNYEDYSNALKELELFDRTKDDKKFTRDFDFKVLSYKNRIVDDYGSVKVLNRNGTMGRENQVIGTHTEQEEVWTKLDLTNFNKGEVITIGIFTTVEKGDNVEWIPNMFGIRIDEWAVWTEGLNANIVSYYKLDEGVGDGGTILDSLGNGTDGTNNDGANTSGIILSAYDFEVGLDANLTFSNPGWAWTSLPLTMNVWVKRESETASNDGLAGGGSGGFTYYLHNNVTGTSICLSEHGGTASCSLSTGLNEGAVNFSMITVVLNSSGVTFFTNGTQLGLVTSFSETWAANTINNIASFGTSDGNFDGVLDEFGFWSRTLFPSEILDLYNNGTGISFTGDFGATIVLNAPVDTFNSSISTIVFNTTVTDITGVSSVTLFIDGVSNETNSSGVNGTYIFTKTVSDGNHNWSIGAINDIAQITNSSTRTFTVDTISPNMTNLNITGANEDGVINFHKLNTNLTFTWNVTDTNLDTCLVSYNGINNTVTCSDNTTSILNVTSSSNKSLNFFANDTFGQNTTSTVTWNYKLFENNQTFTAQTIEGNSETFSINYDVGSGTVTVANLSYNGTQNIGSIASNGGGNFVASETLVAPLVDSDTNITFFWNFTFSDSTTVNASSNNQTVQNITVDDCSANTNVLYNYTMVDEENQTALSNTTLEVDLSILSLNRGTSILNFSKLYTNINPASICINIGLTSDTKYSVDSIARYEAGEHANEFYNIQNFTLQNSSIPQNITLFDLLSVDSTEFQITFKNSDFVVVENALIQINRNYVSEGTFKTVEIPKTDSNGQTVAHLVEKDVIYNMIVTKNGVILGTFNNLIAFCDDVTIGSCFITLNALTSNEVAFNYDDDIGLASTFDYNETSRLLTYTFVTIDGTVKNITLNSVKLDQIGNNTVCDESLVSSSGTLTCTIPGSVGNETIIVNILVNGQLKLINYISAGTEFDLGVIGTFFSLILILSLGLMLLESKAGVIIGVVMGLITSILLSFLKGGLIGIGTSTLWLIVTAIILLWKLNKDVQT